MIDFVKKSKIYKKVINYREVQIDYKNHQNEYSVLLKELKDIHKGDRCFVIGNGPSLTAEDLELIKDEISFASNFIYKIFDTTNWRPTYFCNSDLGVLSKMINDKDFWALKSDIYFFQYNSRFVLKDRKYPPNSLCLFLREAKNYRKKPKFAGDISKEVFDAHTVTYIMLQIAAYMGFSEIIILGVDNNYSVSKDNAGNIVNKSVIDHFYKESISVKSNVIANTERANMGYESAAVFAKKNNIKIYNATRGGMLEVFERKSLEEVLEK